MTSILSYNERYVIFNRQSKIIRKWIKIRYRDDNWHHIYQWIEENTHSYWAVKGTLVYFKSIEDAMAFKLRWL